jgi:hypothetical protein
MTQPVSPAEFPSAPLLHLQPVSSEAGTTPASGQLTDASTVPALRGAALPTTPAGTVAQREESSADHMSERRLMGMPEKPVSPGLVPAEQPVVRGQGTQLGFRPRRLGLGPAMSPSVQRSQGPPQTVLGHGAADSLPPRTEEPPFAEGELARSDTKRSGQAPGNDARRLDSHLAVASARQINAQRADEAPLLAAPAAPLPAGDASNRPVGLASDFRAYSQGGGREGRLVAKSPPPVVARPPAWRLRAPVQRAPEPPARPAPRPPVRTPPSGTTGSWASKDASPPAQAQAAAVLHAATEELAAPLVFGRAVETAIAVQRTRDAAPYRPAAPPNPPAPLAGSRPLAAAVKMPLTADASGRDMGLAVPVWSAPDLPLSPLPGGGDWSPSNLESSDGPPERWPPLAARPARPGPLIVQARREEGSMSAPELTVAAGLPGSPEQIGAASFLWAGSGEQSGVPVQRQAVAEPPVSEGALAAPDLDESAASPRSDQDLDDLARRLYDRFRSHIRDELLIDRERAGLVTDLR